MPSFVLLLSLLWTWQIYNKHRSGFYGFKIPLRRSMPADESTIFAIILWFTFGKYNKLFLMETKFNWLVNQKHRLIKSSMNGTRHKIVSTVDIMMVLCGWFHWIYFQYALNGYTFQPLLLTKICKQFDGRRSQTTEFRLGEIEESEICLIS